jgi:hypothetical protein
MTKKRRGPTTRRVEPVERAPRSVRGSRLLFILVLTVAALAAGVILVMRDKETGASGDVRAPQEPGPVHVHGLGINPADGALFIATHTGLYRAPPGENRAARVGAGLQDTMGFTVVGPDRFLGSGHPDPETMRDRAWPTNLGLIESTDGGKSWRSVSLFGEADFHVLRSRGGRVYGFDSSNGRLLVSGDRGNTWKQRTIPGPLFDLALDPSDASRLVAASTRGLFVSADSARRWRRLEGGVGLLAWPAPGSLYVVDGAGHVWVGAGATGRWRTVGNVGGQPASFLGASARELYVALHDGTIKRSLDGGRTWSIRAAPASR